MKHLWWLLVCCVTAFIGVITWRRHVSQSNPSDEELEMRAEEWYERMEPKLLEYGLEEMVETIPPDRLLQVAKFHLISFDEPILRLLAIRIHAGLVDPSVTEVVTMILPDLPHQVNCHHVEFSDWFVHQLQDLKKGG